MEKIKRIKIMLIRMDLTQAEIGRRMGTSRNYVNALVNYRVKSRPARERFSKAIGKSYEEVWGKSDELEAA